ncbi:MAG: Nramp family divalent metal transporter [Chitinophagaceae bacterium]|jgi:manganese transport protein|nr:Nramp family divalent metal transporter [Chitinophagaceae bacterium]MCF8288964.1 Nramp family divalent metal transporter [Chitinophagaceae bacterium]MCF8421268.1 Nramp family divalent metal transporter [Chitinophagaceae bacterium]
MFHKSLDQLHESVPVQNKTGWRRLFAFIGPAYLVSVGYMDPGNWATDLQGGAAFGFQLIWILLLSNIMAILLQSLSARLGIVRRLDLAQVNRETYPKFVNFCLYILAELAIAATDLAEVLGMAIGIKLLTGLPLMYGTIITVTDTFLFMLLQRYGMRKMEAFIFVLVATIGGSFLAEMIIAKPDLASAAKGLVPSALSPGALYIAVGMIGATVMPHNLYLHSALVQTRKIERTSAGIKKSLWYNFIDSAVALNAAFFVNAAILILAATAFYQTGNQSVAKIEDAHALLAPLLGSKLAPILFAVALIAAGQSSTVTGTLSGQIVMEGYLNLRLNPWIRRLLTRLVAILPAVLVIGLMGEGRVDELLVFSQVILSLQLGFAVIPLIHFVSDKNTMGEFAIKSWVKILAWIVASTLVYLNANLVFDFAKELLVGQTPLVIKILLVLSILFFFGLLLYIILFPIIQSKKKQERTALHGAAVELDWSKAAPIDRIAIAVDFSAGDANLIKSAIAQAHAGTELILIHVVESVTASYFQEISDDEESRKDRERLEIYAATLSEKGFKVNYVVGYKDRVKEIVRIVKLTDAQLLVMGAHHHYGWKDYFFGETIESVRHKVKIPVLIVQQTA